MPFLILALAFGLLAPLASADCTVYQTVTSTVIPDVSTFYTTVTSPTTTYTFWNPTVVSTISVTTPFTSTTSITVGSKTSTKNGGTVTVGATRTLTKTCPKSKCSHHTKKTTTVVATDINTASSTVTSTITQDFLITRPTTSVATSTITSGTPPVTTIVQSTITQVTSTEYETVGSDVGKSATFTVTSGVQTVTNTKTKTVSPSATATVTLFSLQVYNTSIAVDGYTFGNIADTARLQDQASCDRLQDQRPCRTWLFYVDPKTHYLYEQSTGQYAVYDAGPGQWNEQNWIFVDKTTEKLGDRRRFTCKAECGQLLTCAIKGKETRLVLVDGFGIEYAPYLAFDDVVTDPWPAVEVQVVGPTKGRA